MNFFFFQLGIWLERLFEEDQIIKAVVGMDRDKVSESDGLLWFFFRIDGL